MLALFLGFVLSLIGSVPPGLINLSVAQTSMHRGLRPALWLAAGAAGAEFFQALAALVFADWFLAHPAAEMWFRWVSAPVFLGLAVHLIFFAKTPENAPAQSPRDQREFIKGLIISAFNLLAIPYWIFYCAWLRMEGWLSDSIFESVLLAVGVTGGTFATLYVYAWLGRKLVEHAGALARWANWAVGGIFLALGIRLLF